MRLRVGGAASSRRARRRAVRRAPPRRREPPRSSSGRGCSMLSVPQHAQSAWLTAADAATHHSRSPAACSGLPSGPEKGALAVWVPKRACVGALVPPGQASLPEAAHGFMQRALRSAPKREADLIAEIMGSLCVTLNQLRRHALWKATTQRLGQCALQL
eukprot:scaffold9420_cov51-Phaeocystis_antarctica.AAC.2